MMGGTGALIDGMLKKYHELGGEIQYNAEVEKISLSDKKTFFSKPSVSGVKLTNGKKIKSNISLLADLTLIKFKDSINFYCYS